MASLTSRRMFSEESVGNNLVIDVEYFDDDGVFPDAARTSSSTPVAMNVKAASPESRQHSFLVTSDRCSPITETLPMTPEQSSVTDKSPEVGTSFDVSVGEAWSWAVEAPTQTLTDGLTHPVC